MVVGEEEEEEEEVDEHGGNPQVCMFCFCFYLLFDVMILMFFRIAYERKEFNIDIVELEVSFWFLTL